MPYGRRAAADSTPARYRKRKYSRKIPAQTRRPKRPARRYLGGMRRTVSLNKHVFSRYGNAIVVSCNTPTLASDYDFKLNDLINATEFTQLFDQYMILKVVVKIQMITNPDGFSYTNSVTGPTQNNFFPKIWYIRDYDGGASETLSTIKERTGVSYIIPKPNKVYSIVLKPLPLVQTYLTALSTGYAPKRLWIDIAAPTVPHYGLKTVIDCLGMDPADTIGFQYRLETKYYVAFKGVR